MGAPQYEQAGADIGGTGTTNTIPRWTGASTLGDSGLIDDGSAVYTTTRNVGIGTASPAARVNVDGNAVYNNTATQAFRVSNGSTRVVDIGYDSGLEKAFIQPVQLGTAYRDLLLAPNGGNVGIGTASPGSILDVLRTQNSTTNAQVRNLSTGAAAQARMDIVSDASTLLLGVVSSSWTTFGLANGDAYISNNSARIIQFGTGGSERMRISGTAAQVAIGTSSFTSGRALTTVADLDVFGVRVGRGGDGSQTSNTALGRSALGSITTGDSCTAVGSLALQSVTGSRNTAVGYAALGAIGASTDNTALGASAIGNNTGSRNTAVGRNALNGSAGASTGSDNVCIGERAGDSITTGASNIVIGSNADLAAATDSNKLVIGDATNYVATNGGATTYYATAGALAGYIIVRLNGTDVKLPVYAL